MIVISLMLVVYDFAVIDFIIHGICVFIHGVLLQILWLFISGEVGPEGGIGIVLDGLELSVGIEAENGTEGIVGEAEDGISIAKLLHAGIRGKIGLVLNGGEEVDHEIYGEEDADEDKDHYHLIA